MITTTLFTTILTYTVFLPIMSMSLATEYTPEYMIASPENALSSRYTDEQFYDMISLAAGERFNAAYMVAHSEDDPLINPFNPDGTISTTLVSQWRNRVRLANSFGLRVHLFLAEEETMNDDRWPLWYQTAVAYFDDLDVVFVISEEYNQPPHGLTVEEVETRCMYLKELGAVSPVGVHDTGMSAYGLWPFRVGGCVDVLELQWYRTSNPVDGLTQLGATSKYVIISEPPTYPVLDNNWCDTASHVLGLGVGIGLYYGDRDQWWLWNDLPHCEGIR